MNEKYEPDLNPLASIHSTLASSTRDMTSDSGDSWVYGIVVGWEELALLEVAKEHNWGPETVKRLYGLRNLYKEISKILEDNPEAKAIQEMIFQKGTM